MVEKRAFPLVIATKSPCPFGRSLSPPVCSRVTAYVVELARQHAQLEAFFAWVWENPPSPGFVSWWCVGDSETGNGHPGGDYAAHGSQYSGPFGMLNGAVRERADDAESAARIMAGTATPGEERRAAYREDVRFGPGAWGVLTRARCEI